MKIIKRESLPTINSLFAPIERQLITYERRTITLRRITVARVAIKRSGQCWYWQDNNREVSWLH